MGEEINLLDPRILFIWGLALFGALYWLLDELRFWGLLK